MADRSVIWRPQPKQAVMMARPEYEALYGGAAAVSYTHLRGVAGAVLGLIREEDGVITGARPVSYTHLLHAPASLISNIFLGNSFQSHLN